MTGDDTSAPLLAAVREMRDAAASARLELETAGAADARRLRDELAGQLDDYVLPRLEQQGAPLLVVVGGSTGAGKSTLVNTLVGQPVSPAGVLRPTTRSPVLVLNPADAGWFGDDRLLPGLIRTVAGRDAPVDAARSLQLAPTAALPSGLALLDAPDIDSVVEANRELARQLLAAADVWLFVTTAARYADAVPWQLLRVARERATALAVVLDRVPTDALTEVSGHLRQLLDREGLGDAGLLVVPEAVLDAGRVPEAAVAPVRRWLDGLAADAEARAELVRRTLRGALDSLQLRAAALAGALEQQERVAAELLRDVDAAYSSARATVGREIEDGTLLRGEVLARWQEFLGTGQLMGAVESGVGRLRDRIASAITGRAPVQPVEEALESNLAALLQDGLERAAALAAEAWSGRMEGRGLAARSQQDLTRAGRDTVAEISGVVRSWQADVLALVTAQGGDRRRLAKLASYGVNGAGSLLIVGLFAHTGGLTGGEVAIAGGTAALSQRVLEAIFGDQAVRTLATQAREALLVRFDGLLASDADRFRGLVGHAVPEQGSAARLREAARAVRSAR